MNLPTIVICTAAARDGINAILYALGQGSGSLSVPLCPVDPDPTWETPPTHYMMQDMSATDVNVAVWQAMAEDGTLPTLDGLYWGLEGIISEQDAQAAIATGNMQVYSAAGVSNDVALRDQWVASTLNGAGLRFVPTEPS